MGGLSETPMAILPKYVMVRRVCEAHGIEIFESSADTLDDGIARRTQTMMESPTRKKQKIDPVCLRVRQIQYGGEELNG